MTRLTRGALGIVLLAMSGAPATAAPPRQIDYLYINASEGSASGGHAALRFGDQVFHFEHRDPGIIVLAQNRFERFRHLYGDLENRTIWISRIPVSDETYDLLLARFSRHHMVQRQRLEALGAVRGDRALLEALARPGPVAIDGLGLFGEAGAADATDEPGPVEPALAALRARIDERFGTGFVAGLSADLQERLNALDPGTPRPAPAAEDDERLLPPSYTFSERFRDTSQALAALDVLREARPLRSGAVRSGMPIPLGDGEAAAVAKLADALEESLTRLLESPRPDWGLTLLLGMARLTALRHTVASGHWVVLDAFPADATVFPPSRVARRRARMSAIREENRVAFEEARVALLEAADGPFPEIRYARLEAAANRWGEVARALDEGGPLRVHAGVLLPARPGALPVARIPAYDPARLARAREAAARDEADAIAALERDYAYNVVVRNCVSEIFREVDRALAEAARSDDPDRVRAESVRRLGGHVELAGSLVFIPKMSSLIVDDTYAVSERERVPSYRDRRVAAMRREENPLWVFLRESNVVTSTLYRPQPRDSIFLFFTDDVVPARPLFGAANLVTGLAASAAGLAMLPVDGGEMLWGGLRGALFSLPELIFQNIRKGTFDLPEPR
ncbi:MAG TPA: hypothetical protein VIA61_00300 [Methylomirabilota bacterium]